MTSELGRFACVFARRRWAEREGSWGGGGGGGLSNSQSDIGRGEREEGGAVGCYLECPAFIAFANFSSNLQRALGLNGRATDNNGISTP